MFGEEEACGETKSYLKIDLEGANPVLWSEMKSKLTSMIMNIMDFQINTKTDGSVKDEFARISSNVIEFANAKLEKASIENQKLLSEIENILANKGKELAEARKLNAEAEQIELNNMMTKLKIAIGAAKIIASSSKDPELLAFTKNIEDLSFIIQDSRIEKI
nr:hypothetical protein [Mucilaginibacter sp. L294]